MGLEMLIRLRKLRVSETCRGSIEIAVDEEDGVSVWPAREEAFAAIAACFSFYPNTILSLSFSFKNVYIDFTVFSLVAWNKIELDISGMFEWVVHDETEWNEMKSKSCYVLVSAKFVCIEIGYTIIGWSER